MEEVILYHKGHRIRIVENGARNVDNLGHVKNVTHWFCSYVDGIVDVDKHDTECGPGYEVTYNRGNEVGFDTAHMYNENMSEAGKFADALRQALCFINELKKEY